MKKVLGIFTIIVLLIGFLIINALPYAIIFYSGYFDNNPQQNEMNLSRAAVKYSTFKYQKVYTLENLILTAFRYQEYSTAINAYKELEKLDYPEKEISLKAMNSLVAMVYYKQGDLDNALNLANASNNKMMLARIYIDKKDIENAKQTIAEIDENKPRKYLLNAELKILENNWNDALKDIENFIKHCPNHKEGYEVKAKIMKHFGNENEYKNCMNKYYELAQKYNYKEKDGLK